MFKILRKPYAVGLSAMNLLVRLAGGAVALALVLFVQESRGSFAAAGFVAGCFAVGTACGAPVTGRLVDRVGATRVLLVTAAVHAGALLAIAGLPRVPLGVVAGIAVLGGRPGRRSGRGCAVSGWRCSRTSGSGGRRTGSKVHCWKSGSLPGR
ncbi:MFS transporter [Dactylosporangium darangshiense]|uniref:MFS transporter n=1 Tax=Dactylosporangium darangshiense TaxID=579108 RepID=UPI003625FC99